MGIGWNGRLSRSGILRRFADACWFRAPCGDVPDAERGEAEDGSPYGPSEP